MEKINLKIPSKAKYFSSVRLFLSGLLANMDFDIETVEDLKIAISECLNIALKLDCKETIDIIFEISETKIKIEIGEICREDIEKIEELSLSLTILECLVDESKVENNHLLLTANRKK
ncbi:anti-sigma factor [Peptoniphilus catoniae]|uniref:anti-sigma factor n=1 Tax=Peptoniphilus catoniae TaxID=1660341 RepID=UPI0010FE2F20|nr:anti-sigma factor [Peptoniphilus catoniae]